MAQEVKIDLGTALIGAVREWPQGVAPQGWEWCCGQDVRDKFGNVQFRAPNIRDNGDPTHIVKVRYTDKASGDHLIGRPPIDQEDAGSVFGVAKQLLASAVANPANAAGRETLIKMAFDMAEEFVREFRNRYPNQ